MFNRSIAILLIICGVGCLQPTLAQPPDTLWTRTYGGDGADFGFAAVASGDGGYVLCGTSDSFSHGSDRDVFLVKINDSGDTLWTRTHGFVGTWEEGQDIAKTADGGYIVAGYTGIEDVSTDIYLLKLDDEGILEWDRQYGGADVEEARAVEQTPDGGYVIVGLTYSYGAGLADSYIIRTNEIGDTLWAKAYGGELYEVCYDVVTLADSGFVIVSSNTSDGPGATGVELRSLSTSGESSWVRRYGGENMDSPRCLISCLPSGFLVGGWTASFALSRDDMYALRVANNGDSLWMRTYGFPDSSEIIKSAIQTEDGGFLFCGNTGSVSTGADWASVYAVRTDSVGSEIWSAVYGGPNQDVAESVVLSPDGGFLITGWSNSNDVGTFNIYALRIDTELGITNHNRSLIPDRLSIYAYPNPFNAETTISFSLPHSQHTTISVYDLTGRLVTTLADEIMTAGEHAVTFDAAGLPSGIYFARMTAGSQMRTQKMVLLK